MVSVVKDFPKKESEYSQPVISYRIFSYNQELFIDECIESAFSQTYEPLEILITDDYSTDKTFEIIKNKVKSYLGNHRIILNRNDQNLGITQHLNYVSRFCKGELLIGCAGDDISLPERTEKVYNAYLGSDFKAKAIYSDYFILRGEKTFEGNYFIDEKKASLQDILNGSFGFLGAVACYHRDVFDCFEPLANTPFEDTVLGFRAAILGNITFIPEKLVKYRKTEQAVSHKYDLNEKSFVDNQEFLSESMAVFIQSDIFMLKDYLYYTQKFNYQKHFPVIRLLARKIFWKIQLIELIEKQNEIARIFFALKIYFKGVPLKNIIEIERSLLRSKIGTQSIIYKTLYPIYKLFKRSSTYI
jgi:glycosyltransferase involved in cell wall biosynthesis